MYEGIRNPKIKRENEFSAGMILRAGVILR